MCVLASIKDPKLLPFGAYGTPDSFVIHDRKYRPLIRVAAHEDQDERCEKWGNLDIPGAMDLDCHNEFGPCFIRLVSETAQIVDSSERIEHDGNFWFYEGQPDRDRLQGLVDSIPGLGAEIERRDAAAAAAKKAEREAFDWQDESAGRVAALRAAILAKPLLGVSQSDLKWLPRQESIQLESRIMKARAAQVTPLAPGTPMPGAHLHSVPAAPLPDLLTSSAAFVGGFVSPEYLIDGTVQRRYFYSMTAQTGVGKTSIAMRWMAHVVTGRPIGDTEVQQGNVLYLAGENPDDVRARWLVLSREMGIDPNTDKVTWIVGAKDLGAVAQRFMEEVARKGLSFAYVVVDTAAAYNVGDDENSNNQAGAYARQLRSLTNLPGGPCVVVLCHPTKRAADDDLMPRGGGAFLAEVDGNMAVMRKDSLLVVVPFGKFRGDMSWVQRYEIEVIKDHPKLKDARGRQMKSVLARPVGAGTAAAVETRVDRDTELVLSTVDTTPAATPAALARALGWTYGVKSEPNANKVKRILGRLADEKLVVERLGTWRVTPLGEKELNAIDTRRATAALVVPLPPLPH